MPKKNHFILDKIGYAILLMITRAMQYTPRKVSFFIGSMVGSLLWTVLKLEKKRIIYSVENLRRLYPDKPEAELRQIVKAVCRHFGQAYSQLSLLEISTPKELKDLVIFEGFENFEKAWKMDRGVIFATAHFGHFELANAIFAAMGYPVYSVIRTVDNRYVDRLFDNLRGGPGLKIIKKERAAQEIIRRLREKAIVTAAIDINAGMNQMFTPFFGELASTFTTPATFGMRIGSPILPVLSFRDERNDKYIVRIHPIVEVKDTGDRHADVRLVTMEINEIVENAIRQAPEQWLWIHRRWKTRPTKGDVKAHEREMKIIESAMKNRTGV
ncbi:Lipid A biosynthesis lauroyl acyltransferase [hydrothermal vent metagenome]|uniref:Lipid A biosynthesis lauroyl acyltransferase n=1 Tax=hydrothermal vent metagenome TaxID=652676 RepID=A0A3B1CFJ8_9ZZZZ